ncbi:response regulator [uncultured Desulfosarcina sp.]|uniref:response regulator n=1 Tax=uncultured Desulfosarcina sp. TaxID=218289 RepID=UPI0029C8AB8E|nr:response regulator [uncultured Desulfosarcina sp.]
MKMLVVDDELVSRKKMEKILQHYGVCHAVDSGKAAIEAYTQALLIREPFDLITLDVSMPGMGGTEVLLMIRILERKNSIPKDKQVKILMVTSHADQETVMASIEAGCDDYIKKPFSLERVTRKLNKIGLTTPT